MGFFNDSVLTTGRAPLPVIARCGACQLFTMCDNPKMPVWGEGARKVMLVGESPGKTEDEQNRPFVGSAGQYLRAVLRKLNVDADRDCWITNSLICRPPANAAPTDKQIGYCRPNLTRAIAEHKPNVVVMLGAAPVRSVIGALWKEDTGAIGRWVGHRIPCHKPNAWLCPTYHPSHVIRSVGGNEPTAPVLERLFERHLAEAFALADAPPWRQPPNFTSRVRVVLDHNAAAKAVDALVAAGKPLAFDYETDRLKPDADGASIYCCAVSDGTVSVAYPWYGAAIAATRRFLVSAVPKIGWNQKFEGRWTLALLGVLPRNWIWDGMLGAHTIDNRPQTAGLKFQSFVTLGVGAYDDHIKPYLRADGNNVPNRIRELDRQRLLTYCGLDALYEWLVCDKQMKLVGVDPLKGA